MSLKNTKNLLIIAAVLVALTAGTVLLGSYTNILSNGLQTKTCQEKASTCCPAVKAYSAENAKVECTETAECGSVAKTCPLDPTKPCCGVEGTPGCCPKTDCPLGCTKPCCAEKAESGCCPTTTCPPDCIKPCCTG